MTTFEKLMNAINDVERIDKMMKTATPVEQLALYYEWQRLDKEREKWMKQYHKELMA